MKNSIGLIFVIFTINLFYSCKKETKNIDVEEEFETQVYSNIVIENQDYDFGLVTVNDTISYTYKVKNISEKPLIVARVISNCDCVEINFEKKPLQKNQVLNIKTKFIATSDKKGSVNNLMLIECNIEKGVAVLSMSGFISE